MGCMLIRVLFAVSTRSTKPQNPLTSVFSLRQFPLYSKTQPPAVLKEHFKEDTFKKSQEYGKDKAKFALCSGLLKQVLDSTLLHYGVYARSWDVAGSIRSAIGYGPDCEVSPIVSSLQILLTSRVITDYPVAPLHCYLMLRLLHPKHTILRLSNFCSRGKAWV